MTPPTPPLNQPDCFTYVRGVWHAAAFRCPDNNLMCGDPGFLTCRDTLNDCSGFGDCFRGRCFCHAGRGGADCSLPICIGSCPDVRPPTHRLTPSPHVPRHPSRCLRTARPIPYHMSGRAAKQQLIIHTFRYRQPPNNIESVTSGYACRLSASTAAAVHACERSKRSKQVVRCMHKRTENSPEAKSGIMLNADQL